MTKSSRLVTAVATLFLSLVTVTTSSAAEGSIEVLDPNGGETFKSGQEFTIRWKSDGIGDFVRITAQGGAPPKQINISGGKYTIAEKTENDGEYKFAIPYEWAWPGFKVLVWSSDGRVHDESDDYFTHKIDRTARKPANALIRPGDRVVFIGDSNTYAGKFITHFHARVLAAAELDRQFKNIEILNLGLSSETASGLSEPDHPFPRPCVLDRLDRVLQLAKPTVVVACYGMNDAIYHPFDEKRFAAFKKGINEIITKTKATGARIIIATPPPFDADSLKGKNKLRAEDSKQFAWFAPYEDYDSVMGKYAEWERGLENVDAIVKQHQIHTIYIETHRKKNADFTWAGDGVHYSEEAHKIVAEVLANELDLPRVPPDDFPTAEKMKLIAERQNLLRDAWLTHVGHKRPKVKKGLPLEEAQAKAKELWSKIVD